MNSSLHPNDPSERDHFLVMKDDIYGPYTRRTPEMSVNPVTVTQ